MDGEFLLARAGPVIYPFASRYPHHRRTSDVGSSSTCILAHAARGHLAAFRRHRPWGLFLTLIHPTLFRHYGLAHTLRCLSIAIPASLLPALRSSSPG